MKTKLRRISGLLCATALAVSSLAVSAPVFAADNLALSATPFVDSIHLTYGAPGGHLATNINDGNDTGTRWQSNNKMLKSNGTPDTGSSEDISARPYFGLAWEESTEITSLVIKYEASDPGANGIEIYYTQGETALAEMTQPDGATAAVGAKYYTEGTTQWTKLDASQYTLVRGGGADGSYESTDTVTFNSAFSATAIKIIAVKAANDKDLNLSVFEIEAYNISGTPYDLTIASAAVKEFDKAFGNAGNVFGYTEDTWAAFDAARVKLANAVAQCENKAEGEVADYPDTASVNALVDEVYDAMDALTLTNIGANALYRAEFYYNTAGLSGYSGGINVMALTDGEKTGAGNVNWQPAAPGQDNLYLQLTEPGSFNELVFFCEFGKLCSVDIYYTTDAGVDALDSWEELEAASNITWTPVSNAQVKYEFGNFGKDEPSDSMTTGYKAVGFDEITNVTGIKLVVNSAAITTKLYEVEAYLDEGEENCFTGTATFENTEAGQKFVVTNVTKEVAGSGKTIRAEYTITRGETTATGTVDINNAWGMIMLGSNYITSADIEGGHGGDYVTGVLFKNVQEGDVIDVTFSVIG